MVTLKIGAITGMVTAVSDRFGKITYEIAYAYNGEHRMLWADRKEFDLVQIEKKEIGF